VKVAGKGEAQRYGGMRKRMVEALARSGIRDARVLAAMESVPRHLFIPEALREQAYQINALPIGDGQTISAPDIVAMMSEALELTGHERVLEVGTGSGYQAAILSKLAERVISVERMPQLASQARSQLDRIGVANVVVYLGDGTRGWPRESPFDGIIVTAGGPEIPKPLLDQLAPGGRLVGPFGSKTEQLLIRIRRLESGEFKREVLGRCFFVDLIGEYGWER